MPLEFFEVDASNIANGGIITLTWTPDKPYTIKYLFLRRSDGNPFTATEISVMINDIALTHSAIPAAVLGKDIQNALELNWSIGASQTLKVSGTNMEGTTITIYMTIVCEIPSMPTGPSA